MATLAWTLAGKSDESDLWDWAGRVADAALAYMFENPDRRVYMYHKASTGPTGGSIGVFADECRRIDYDLSDPEPIPRHIGRDGVARWAYDRMRRLPILAI